MVQFLNLFFFFFFKTGMKALLKAVCTKQSLPESIISDEIKPSSALDGQQGKHRANPTQDGETM